MIISGVFVRPRVPAMDEVDGRGKNLGSKVWSKLTSTMVLDRREGRSVEIEEYDKGERRKGNQEVNETWRDESRGEKLKRGKGEKEEVARGIRQHRKSTPAGRRARGLYLHSYRQRSNLIYVPCMYPHLAHTYISRCCIYIQYIYSLVDFREVQ